MKVRHINISNFRGISTFEWGVPDTPIICLIGPGDSMKTTILDAIEYALSPYRNLSISDSDFYMCQTKSPIQIDITVGELPDALLNENKYGLHLRGWSPNGGVIDEPEDGNESVLTIRLCVTETLEPSWTVYTERGDEGGHPRISAYDREKLGAAPLGGYIDRHLSWKPGSALLRLTGDLDGVSAIVAQANRDMRNSLAGEEPLALSSAANEAQRIAEQLGVNISSEAYRAAIDPQATTTGAGLFTLHDGQTPIRSAGLGSRRLITLGLQKAGVREGAILLIDELESGLEPYRLRHLIRVLRSDSEIEGLYGAQVFATTHSPIAITEVHNTELFIVCHKDGEVKIRSVDEDVYRLVKHAAEGLLARKLLLCEGKTEIGFAQALDEAWANEDGGQPFGCLGVVPVLHEEGGGGAMPSLAIKLAGLSYDVVYWGDSDTDIQASVEKMNAAGVQTIIWGEKCAIEDRVCLDISWATLRDFVTLSLKYVKKENLLNKVEDALGRQLPQSPDIEEWRRQGISEDEIRKALGKGSKAGKWFKKEDAGRELGKLVANALPKIAETDLGKKLQMIKDWAYGN